MVAQALLINNGKKQVNFHLPCQLGTDPLI